MLDYKGFKPKEPHSKKSDNAFKFNATNLREEAEFDYCQLQKFRHGFHDLHP